MMFLAVDSTIPIWIVLGYLAVLLGLGIYTGSLFRGTSRDYFIASRSIGSFMLLMSVFGTTMTGFALVGSTGKAFTTGVATYGAMAVWSGIVHSAIFFVIGLRLWAIGKRHGYVTQVQFFRARFNSKTLGTVLFVLLVLLIVPYLLIGIISAGKFVEGTTRGMFGETGIAPWITGLVICGVVLTYVFLGGMRSAVWANTFQTIIFMLTGVVAFLMISKAVAEKTEVGSGSLLENIRRATEHVETHQPGRLARGFHRGEWETYEEQKEKYDTYQGKKDIWDTMAEEYGEETAQTMGADPPGEPVLQPKKPRPGMTQLVFITFLFIPVSVGMFPHVFQHWLTAKSAKTFRLAIVAHPICIAIVWLPCILIGVWAAGLAASGDITVPHPNEALGMMVKLIGNPWLLGLLMAGVLAAIMSSLDSQFACLGTMFTNDIVIPIAGKDYFSDKDTVKIARLFVVGVVVVSYGLALVLMKTTSVFKLGVWCFSGFTALFPILFAALYWKRVTTVGAYACIAVAVGLWVIWFKPSVFGKEDFLVFGMLPVAPLTMASTAALIIGTWLHRFVCWLVTHFKWADWALDERHVNRFFPRAVGDGRRRD
jgi:SSS family solute:Na+ symporter